MAETRILAPLLGQVERADGKAILIGDPHQLPAVGAGGLFAAIVERNGAVELHENRRQHDELERGALAAIRAGRGRDYLAYAERRRATRRLRRPDRDTRATARRLVAARPARPRRQRHDRPPPPRRRRAQRARPRCSPTEPAASAQNGSSPTPASSSPPATASSASATPTHSASRTAPAERSRRSTPNGAYATASRPTAADVIELPARYLERRPRPPRLRAHRPRRQGATVERAFVLGRDEGTLQEWGYVALSRAREATRLYVVGEHVADDRHAPDRGTRSSLDRFATALEASGQERLAVRADEATRARRADQPATFDDLAVPETKREALRAIDRVRRTLLSGDATSPDVTRQLAELDAERRRLRCEPAPPARRRRDGVERAR